MHKHALRAIALAALIAAPSLAQAQIISQDNGGTTIDASGAGYGQSFVMPTSYNRITGAAVMLGMNTIYNPGSIGKQWSGLLTISLWNQLPNVANAGRLATGTNSIVLFGGPASFYGVNFGSILAVPNEEYYITFATTDSPASATALTAWMGANADVYGGSNPECSEASDWGYCEALLSDSGVLAGDYSSAVGDGSDMAFRIYGESVTTPEPASMVLIATGLVGVFGAARRRKQS